MRLDLQYTALKNDLATRISAALLSASLTDFQDYIDYPPFDAQRRQLAVYGGGGTMNEIEREDAILVQCQIPGISTNINKYLGVIHTTIWATDPSVVSAHNLDLNYEIYYPGEQGDGYAGTDIYFELKFDKQLDSCEEE